MSEKRRDNKGRLLRTGESQRKDGKYEYKYTDNNGIRHSIYSWKLVETDRAPQGKRCNKSLREMAKDILRELEASSESKRESPTLNQCFDKLISLNTNLKASTIYLKTRTYDKHIRHTFGDCKVEDIKYSDIRKYLSDLKKDHGYKATTMRNLHGLLQNMFEIAYKDGYIQRNPANGVLKEIGVDNRTILRESKNGDRLMCLSIEQQIEFLDFVKTSNRHKYYLLLFQFLFNTGCRVGEVAALRWENIDFERGFVTINHSLMLAPDVNDDYVYQLSTPKTDAGVRKIPLTKSLQQQLLTEYKKDSRPSDKLIIDGFSGFVFSTPKSKMITSRRVNCVIESVLKRINKRELEMAASENREAVIFPKFTVHCLRHTFCSRLCECESNLKVIQEIMGHSDISLTMKVYAEATEEAKQKGAEHLENYMNTM